MAGDGSLALLFIEGGGQRAGLTPAAHEQPDGSALLIN
jgi:hypothetical protein